MKEVYVIRHGEKDNGGILTKLGQKCAKELGKKLPDFEQVISSDSSRTKLTALLATNTEPIVDDRAGFFMAAQEKSDAINHLAEERGISFIDAVDLYNDGEMSEAVRNKAAGLNELIDETLKNLNENQSALIVSHDLTITPAMALRGLPKIISTVFRRLCSYRWHFS
jgi:broad specificity phosphatase PhoE